jgi:hypothetical protein
MKFRVTCKEATHLLLRAQDEPLPWADRMRLRLHLYVCATCPRFVKQLELMRGAFTKLRQGDAE